MLKNFVENLSRFFSEAIGYDIASYCKLNCAYDENTFITKEGGLASFLLLRGVSGYADEMEAQNSLAGVYKAMHTALTNGDHTFHFSFTQDLDSAYNFVKDSMEASYATLKRLNLESLSDLLDSDALEMSRHICSEWCLVGIFTHPSVLTKEDLKRSAKERMDYIKNNNVPLLLNCQNPFIIETQLCNPHQATLENTHKVFAGAGIMAEILNTKEILYLIKKELEPDFTSTKWKPTLMTDILKKGYLHVGKRSATDETVNDASHLFPMPIAMQLCTFDHEIIRKTKLAGSNVVKIANRYYCPIVLEEAPEVIDKFVNLLNKIQGTIPFRISFEIRKGGLTTNSTKQMFLSVFGFMGQINRNIKQAYDELSAIENEGEIIVNLKMICTTWADNLEELARRQAVLTKVLQGWGSSQVTSNIGDTYAGVLSSTVGFGKINSAVPVPCPLGAIIEMLPILRPASPWSNSASSFNFCSNRKLFPMQIGSKLQDTWNDAFYAPPGSGKSVTMNCLNLASLLAPGLTELPPMLILDVGPSASGIIHLLKSALPDDRKYLVSYNKLRMSEEYTINPFDTLPGCREPIPEQRETLRSIILFLMSGDSNADGESAAPPPMSDKLAGLLIDEVYAEYSDKGHPKLYQKFRDHEVDAALTRWNIEPQGEISWWRIADKLMEKGDEYHSSLAQRYAVPTFDDCIKVLRNPTIQDLFNKTDDKIRTDTTQTLVSAFQVTFSSAIREYPVLKGATKFSVGESRVVVFDLNEVRHSKKQTGLMYLLTMTSGIRRFYAKESELDIMTRSAPEIYHPLHKKMAKTYGEELKSVAFDEFHNTGGAPAIRAAVRVIQREGRKWGIRTTLSSQLLDDFDEQMIALMSSVYIMKFGNYREVEKAKKLFNLSDEMAENMYNTLNGPPKLFAYYMTKKGRFIQFLENRPGVVKLWALTTDQDEMNLRDTLYKYVPQQEARRLLAKRFPKPGAATMEINSRRKEMGEEHSESIIDMMVKELLALKKQGY